LTLANLFNRDQTQTITEFAEQGQFRINISVDKTAIK